MRTTKILSCRSVGFKPCIDLEVDSDNHNFYANGLITSNSHAVAYAATSARMVHLKFNYPLEFFLSTLRMARQETDSLEKFSVIEKEMTYFNIKLLPPHLVKSDQDFSIEGSNIRFGLSSIRGIANSAEKIKKLEADPTSKIDCFGAVKDAGIGIGILSALIQAGCLEGFNQSRCRLILEAQIFNLLTGKEKKLVKKVVDKKEVENSDDLIAVIKFLTETVDPTSKTKSLYIKPSRFDTIKKNYQKYKEVYLNNRKNEDLANYLMEERHLGFSFSQSLAGIFGSKNPNIQPIKEILNTKLEERDKYRKFVGVAKVLEVMKRKSKAGNNYAKITCEDESARIDLFAFNGGKRNTLDLIQEQNNGKFPAKGDIIYFSATKKDGESSMYVEELSIQSNCIVLKHGDLK